MARFRFKRKKLNISRVVSKLAVVLVSLYAGGVIVTQLGQVMNGTTSPFNQGLTLIGWTVSTGGQIQAYSGSGILAVIGIIGVASIVLEFVELRMK